MDTEKTPDQRVRRILVVDDSFELLEWMKLDMESRGYEVHTALDGEECICQVEEVHPPCVLLDVMMPGSPRLVRLLKEHPVLLKESTILLDDSVFCVRDRHRESLYSTLLSMSSAVPLLRGRHGRPLVYQRAEDIHEVVSAADFQRKHGEVRIHLDGYTTCQLISSCRSFRDVHIVLFTAGGPGPKNERVQRAFRAGAKDYLLKSEYYTTLFERLEAHLGR